MTVSIKHRQQMLAFQAEQKRRKALEDRLDAIPHTHLYLTHGDIPLAEQNCHRPKLSVWAGLDAESVGAHVVLSLAAMWGQPVRFAELTPLEARAMAKLLCDAADAVDREVG